MNASPGSAPSSAVPPRVAPTEAAAPGAPAIDPEAERVLSKVRRLMAISLGLTGLAIAVVLMLVGWRVAGTGDAQRGPAEVSVALPNGARVIATTVTADRIAVTAEIDGRTELRLYDLHTLAPRGTLRIAVEP